VPRRRQRLDAQLADLDRLAAGEPDDLRRRRRSSQRLDLAGADVRGGARRLHHLFDAVDVIVMRVGDQHRGNRPPTLFRFAQQAIDFERGIDDGAPLTDLARNQLIEITHQSDFGLENFTGHLTLLLCAPQQ